MMSVKEYANDVNSTVAQILNLCKDLNIDVSSENDMLSEDDIILLDSTQENIDVSIEEEVDEEEQLNEEIEEKLGISDEIDKTKPKATTIKPKNDNTKFLKDKKQMYKNKEKLQQNKEDSSEIILFKDKMTVKELAEELDVNPMEIIKKLNIKLIGHYRYYGITDNYNKLVEFQNYIIRTLFKELRKRGQKKRINWEKYETILRYNSIVNPKIYVKI